jgi:hypothetical protein
VLCEGDVGGASVVDGGVSDFRNVYYKRYFDLLCIHVCFATNIELISYGICVSLTNVATMFQFTCSFVADVCFYVVYVEIFASCYARESLL